MKQKTVVIEIIVLPQSRTSNPVSDEGHGSDEKIEQRLKDFGAAMNDWIERFTASGKSVSTLIQPSTNSFGRRTICPAP